MIDFEKIQQLRAMLSVLPEQVVTQEEKDAFVDGLGEIDKFVLHMKVLHGVDEATVSSMIELYLSVYKNTIIAKVMQDKETNTKNAMNKIFQYMHPFLVEFVNNQQYHSPDLVIDGFRQCFAFLTKLSNQNILHES